MKRVNKTLVLKGVDLNLEWWDKYKEWYCPECKDWTDNDRFCSTCGIDMWDQDNIKFR